MHLARRADEEGEIVLACGILVAVAAAHMQGVRAAADVGRKNDFHARLPTQVVDVVVMKVDGAILFGATAPVMGFAVPVRSLHRASRQMDKPAVKGVGPGIDYPIGFDLVAKI